MGKEWQKVTMIHKDLALVHYSSCIESCTWDPNNPLVACSLLSFLLLMFAAWSSTTSGLCFLSKFGAVSSLLSIFNPSMIILYSICFTVSFLCMYFLYTVCLTCPQYLWSTLSAIPLIQRNSIILEICLLFYQYVFCVPISNQSCTVYLYFISWKRWGRIWPISILKPMLLISYFIHINAWNQIIFQYRNEQKFSKLWWNFQWAWQ